MSEKPEPTERPVATLPVIADLYADGRVELPPPGGRPTSDLDPYGRRRWAADDYVAQAVVATDRAADALEGGTARAADLLDEAGDRIEQATATLGAVAGSFIRPPEPTRPDGLGDTVSPPTRWRTAQRRTHAPPYGAETSTRRTPLWSLAGG